MRIFRQRGLDELCLKTAERMANTNLDIQGMVRDESKNGILNRYSAYLLESGMIQRDLLSGGDREIRTFEKGKFISPNEKGQGWGVFYVNPVDWLDEESDNIGLVYLGWDGIRTLIDSVPITFVNQIDSKGWNKTLADVGSIKEYKDDPRLQKLLQEREQKGFDLSSGPFFQDEGWVFYEIPNVPTPLGVMNWWW